MSPRNDLNSESFGKRVKKLEAQSARHTKQINEAAEHQDKLKTADVLARSKQRREELEAELNAPTQMPPATPPLWMLDDAAQQRLKNFQTQGPGIPPGPAAWEQQQTEARHHRHLGQQLSDRQHAERQQRQVFDAAVNQLRQQRGASAHSQSRSKGRHDDGVQF